MRKSCNCKSYNWGIGKVQEVVLPRPNWLADGQRLNGVPVDACIADDIKRLWEAGVRTAGSCCGHNRQCPSLVLADGEDKYDLIREIVGDGWQIQQWKLTDVLPPGIQKALHDKAGNLFDQLEYLKEREASYSILPGQGRDILSSMMESFLYAAIQTVYMQRFHRDAPHEHWAGFNLLAKMLNDLQGRRVTIDGNEIHVVAKHDVEACVELAAERLENGGET